MTISGKRVALSGAIIASLAASIVAVSRRLDRSELGRSWMGRNARIARMGARVGGTYATTAAARRSPRRNAAALNPPTQIGICRFGPGTMTPRSSVSNSPSNDDTWLFHN